MALVILLPTYQRPETLQWSLESVLRQNVSKISEKRRIVILNNDVATRSLVEKSVVTALRNVVGNEFNNVDVVQRDPPLLGVFNLYKGMEEFTRSGDIAIIHGDDDLMLQNSLAERYLIAKASPFALSITKATGGCYFFRDSKNIHINDINTLTPLSLSSEWRCASKGDLIDYCLPFVSAYTCKVGREFWSIYEQALGWAKALPLEDKIRLPFLPFYIGVSAWKNAQLIVIPKMLIKRGQFLQLHGISPPRVITEYANTGIILQTGLAVLNNEDLGTISELNDLRKDFRNATLEHLLSSLFRRDGVSLSQLAFLYRQTKINWCSKELFLPIIHKNIRSLIRKGFGLSNLRNRMSGWGEELSPGDFWHIWECGAKEDSRGK